MARLKIVPKKDWDVLTKDIDKGADVLLIPAEVIANGSLGDAVPKLLAMEGIIDYDFGGEPDVRINILDEYPSFHAVILGLGRFDDEEGDE